MGKEENEMSLEELIAHETGKRLEEMESPDYDFPEKIGKGDIVAMVIGVVASAVLIVLCMTGVIQ